MFFFPGLYMVQHIGVTAACSKLGALVDLVRQPGETVVLMKNGKPAAALVPYAWLERYRKQRAARLSGSR